MQPSPTNTALFHLYEHSLTLVQHYLQNNLKRTKQNVHHKMTSRSLANSLSLSLSLSLSEVNGVQQRIPYSGSPYCQTQRGPNTCLLIHNQQIQCKEVCENKMNFMQTRRGPSGIQLSLLGNVQKKASKKGNCFGMSKKSFVRGKCTQEGTTSIVYTVITKNILFYNPKRKTRNPLNPLVWKQHWAHFTWWLKRSGYSLYAEINE